MKIRNILLAALVISVFISCEPWDMNCKRGNGVIKTEERTTTEFSGIEVNGSFVVYVDSSSETSVMVEADENLLDYIATNVRGDKLVIDTYRDRCLRSDNITVHVTSPVIHDVILRGSGVIDCGNFNTQKLEVSLQGSGDINLNYINADECEMVVEGSGDINGTLDAYDLEVDIDGSGEVRLEGSAHDAELDVTGSGRIRASDMDIDNCYASITGSGDIYVFVYDLLDVIISGSGRLYYEGNPTELNTDIYGSGKVVKR